MADAKDLKPDKHQRKSTEIEWIQFLRHAAQIPELKLLF